MNVDDITLATGGSKPMRSDRSLANYILYRGNLYDSTVVVVNDNIASDVMSYVEEGWEDLPFGIYEWGIQAKYEGYAPTPDATRSEVIIGEGATTNSYLPTYIFYNYFQLQLFVIPALFTSTSMFSPNLSTVALTRFSQSSYLLTSALTTSV